mgnify:CR=1 FL=1
MRIKEIHRRILGGCLACLLCLTGSIPAFAAETATPANAEASLVLVTEIHKEAKIRWYLLQ